MFIGQAAKRGSSLSLSTRRRRKCLHTIYVPFLSWRIFSPFMWLRFWRNKREDSSSGTLSISFHLLFLSETFKTVVEGEFLGGSFKNCLNDRKLILWIFNETRNYEYIDNNNSFIYISLPREWMLSMPNVDWFWNEDVRNLFVINVNISISSSVVGLTRRRKETKINTIPNSTSIISDILYYKYVSYVFE